MDIITHTLSGMAAGSCLAFYAKNGWKEKVGILLLSGVGGALPDIDAITAWSGFAPSIRAVFGAKLWYSHHAFMHSLAGGLMCTLLLALILYITLRRKKKRASFFADVLQRKRLLLLGFFAGFILHLVEDMVTPAGSWGGVRLFFPATVYIGGTGDVWWWNNYDIFLIFKIVLDINLLLLVLGSILKKSFRRAGTILFLAGVIAAAVQVKTRPFNFNGKPHDVCETESKQIQRNLLGKKLYRPMERFDRAVKVPF